MSCRRKAAPFGQTPPMTPFVHTHQGRNKRLIITLALVTASIIAAWLLLDLSPWIAGVMLLFLLPGAWEVATNPKSTLEIDATTLSWSGPNGTHSLLLAALKEVRFDTKLDFSVRVTLIQNDDRKIRIPPDTLPHHKTLEEALTQRGVPCPRRHFHLL